MPITYPVSSGGGGSSNATQLRGIDISTNSPQNFQVLTYQNFGTPEWRPGNTNQLLAVYSSPNYFSGTSEVEVTKFKVGDLAAQPTQEFGSYISFQASIENNQTASFKVSGSNEGILINNFPISSSDFLFYSELPLSASSIYTVFVSSSNVSSQFKIYNISVRFQ